MAISKPIVLAIFDGWGETFEKKGNPFFQANLPTIEKLNNFYPKLLLQASGLPVGLPWGVMGNSEVGHQTLGSGQIVYQNLPRITLSIENGDFFKNENIVEAMQKSKEEDKAFHIFGLLSNGAIHSHIDHMLAIVEMAKEQDLKNVFIHPILDGRDAPQKSGIDFLQKLQESLDKNGVGKIASVAGRYYTMDRNENWDRTEKAFVAMTSKSELVNTDPAAAINEQYQKEIFDEKVKPVTIVDGSGEPVGNIKDGDIIFFTNFRKDRAKQISEAFTVQNFDKFSENTRRPEGLFFTSMTEYSKELPVSSIAFPPKSASFRLGEVLSQNGKKQLRIAESEKYAHVTYFFNCGVETAYEGEDRAMIPSKNAPSYAEIPEMSAPELTDRIIEEIERDHYDFILVNYANPDMVGHTGDADACIKTLETTDQCLERLIPKILERNGALLITADHGNVEELINLKTGEIDTEHSTNPVPFWFVTATNHSEGGSTAMADAPGGILCDVAPTILDLMQIPIPPEVTGTSLLSFMEQIDMD